jgi:periplasmic protein TonB
MTSIQARTQTISFSNSPARYGLALVLALLTAMGLFLLMDGLIGRGRFDLGGIRTQPLPQFIRADATPEAVRERQREKPTPPEPPEQLPPMEAMANPVNAPPDIPRIDPPPLAVQPDLALAGVPVAMPPAVGAPPGDPGLMRYTGPLAPVHQVMPRYPHRARMEGVTGWVRLEFVIQADGGVRDIRVVAAEPARGIFDMEAVRALSRWRFQPQTRDGETVPALATITIAFNLEG